MRWLLIFGIFSVGLTLQPPSPAKAQGTDLGGIPPGVTLAIEHRLREGASEEARLHLIAFFVGASDVREGEVRSLGLERGWAPQQVGFFDSVRSAVQPWGESPEKVFQAALDLRGEAKQSASVESWRETVKGQVAWDLLLSSADRGMDEARLEIARGRLESRDERERAAGQEILRRLAHSGFPAAIQELSAHYESGSVFPKEDAKALYWAMRGVSIGIPMQDAVDRLRSRLSPDTIRRVEGWRGIPYP